MAVKFTNNAVTTLSASISAGVTQFSVASNSGFPSLSGADHTYVTIDNEVVKVTAISGTTFTCIATSSSHTNGANVELRMTAELLDDFATDLEAMPKTGGTFTGAIAMSNNAITGVKTPVATTDAVTKAYSDLNLLKTGGTITGNVSLNDNVLLGLGSDSSSGSDLILYHDGSNAYINTSTGALRLSSATAGSSVQILGSGETLAEFTDDGDVDLFYDGSVKFSTTTAGINVVGNIALSGTVDGVDIQSLNSAVTSNTAKTGITSSQTSAILANSSKVGITSAQASAITANTAKTGITSGQASAITANTAKVTNATHTGDVTGSGALTIANNAVTTAKLNLISTSSVPSIEARGDGTTDGYIQLNCSQNSHGIKLKSPPHSANASYTLTFPTDDGNSGEVLTTNGSGVLSWQADSTTDNTKLPLAGGTMTGNIVMGSNLVDGVDISARDSVLTSTTTTAGAALPKAGGTMTGNIAHAGDFTLDVEGALVLDANDSGYVTLKDNGTAFGEFNKATNDFVISSKINDGDMVFKGKDGSSVITALSLDMSALGDAYFNRHVKLTDNGNLVLGGGDDLLIYHDHANQQNKMLSASLPLILAGTTVSLNNGANNQNMLVATQGSSVDLYHNNVKKFETSNSGATVTGNLAVTGTVDGIDIASRDAVLTSTTTTAGNALPKAGGTMTGDLIIPDNIKLEIGSLSGGDLQIYHDSSAGASYIKDVGTGSLQIGGSSQVNILNGADTEYCAKFITDGAVQLYYDNAKKLETTSAGVTISGALTTASEIVATSFTATNAGQTKFYKPTNSGNPEFYLGASDTNRLGMQTVFNSGTQLLAYAHFFTQTTSGSADAGYITFSIDDGSEKFRIDDGGVNVTGAIAVSGGITAGGTISNSTGTIDAKILSSSTPDISTGENNGLRLTNTNGSGSTWHITCGQTGSNNSTFTIRNGVTNTNVMTCGTSGNVTLAGTLTATLATNSITSTQLAANSVDSDQYVNYSIDAVHLSDSLGSLVKGVTDIGRDSNDYMSIGTTAFNWYLDGSNDMRLENDGDLHCEGNVIAYSSTISDERLKHDIEPITDALSKVNQLNGVTFTYNADDKKSAGLIAQDVEKVLPSAVSEKKLPLKIDDGNEYKVLQYDQTIGLLVEAIKELTAKVEELENK